MRIKFKIDDQEINKYLDEMRQNGVDINIKNFGQVDSQLKNLISNIHELKSLEKLNLINDVQLTDLKEVVTLLKEVNNLNKGIKINFINNGESNGLSSELKKSIDSQTKLVKDFAKKIGVDFNEEFKKSMEQALNGDVDTALENLAKQKMSKLSEQMSKSLKSEAIKPFKEIRDYLKNSISEIYINPKDFDKSEIDYIKKAFKGVSRVNTKEQNVNALAFDQLQQVMSNTKQFGIVEEHTSNLQDFGIALADILNKYKDIKRYGSPFDGLTDNDEARAMVEIDKELVNLTKQLKDIDSVKNNIKNLRDFELEDGKNKTQSLEKEIKLKEELQKIEDKEFDKLYKDTYTEAEKSIVKQIDIQKKLINAKENESETLLKNLEIEEKKYKNLKMQLDVADRVKLTKTKDEIKNNKLEPLISKEIDKLIEQENKLNEQIAERALKNQDNLNVYKSKTTSKIDTLDDNVLPKEKIDKLKSDLSNLQIGYNKTDIQNIQNDLNKLIDLEQKLNREKNSKSKLSEQVYKENDTLELFKHKKQNMINDLFSNDLIPKDKLIEIEQQLNSLDIGYKKVEIQKIEDELSNLIKLEKDLKHTKDEQINSMKNAWNTELKALDDKKKFEEEFINKSEQSINKNEDSKITQEMLMAKKQAEEVNKVLDKNWKDIEKFREVQNDSLSEMGYKFKGLYQTEEIDNFRKELSKLSPTSETLQEDIDKLAWKIKDFKHELSTRNDMYKLGVEVTGLNNGIGIKSSQDDIKKLIKQIGGYNAEIQKIDSTPILKNGNEIKKVNYRVKEGKNKWHEYQLSIIQAVDSGKASLRALDKGLKDISNTQQGLIGHLRKAWTSVLSFAGVTSVFYGAVRGFKSGIQSIIELDSAIIDLKKVTDESTETYTKFTHVANETAIAIGHTTKSAIDSTTEFAKLGFTLSEAGRLAKEALIYSNIGDIDVDSATKSITSTLKGFNMTADETRHIIDAYNEVGNNFAITTGGIGEALQRSASSLSEANNTFEQSIGLITAGNDSVQDAEKVGNALKTISIIEIVA